MTEIASLLELGLFVLGIIGLGWLHKSTLSMAIKMIITDSIDREKNVRSMIYEAQTVERSLKLPEDIIKEIPVPVQNEIIRLKQDWGILAGKLQLELDYIKNELIANAPPELLKRLERLEELIKNGS